MAIAYVQSAKNFDTQADSSASFGSNVTAGNLIFVGAVSYTTSTITSVSDNQSNNYTRIGTDISSGGDSNNKLSSWYAKNVNGGSVTVTVHSSSGTSVSIFIAEYSGLDTSSPLDQEAHAEASATNSPSSGNTSTTSQADELLVGQLMGEWATNISITAGTSYTVRQSYTDGNVAIAGAIEDRVVSSTGTYPATFTLGTIATSLVRIATFKAASGTAYTLTAANGSYTLTGNAAGLTHNTTLTAAQGSYTLTGNAAALPIARRLTAASGTYTLTGQNATLLAGKILTAAQGSYVLTGNAASFPVAHTLTAARGTYTLTGRNATLTGPGAQATPIVITGRARANTITGNTRTNIIRGSTRG